MAEEILQIHIVTDFKLDHLAYQDTLLAGSPGAARPSTADTQASHRPVTQGSCGPC